MSYWDRAEPEGVYILLENYQAITVQNHNFNEVMV